jgi:hypothetical protein
LLPRVQSARCLSQGAVGLPEVAAAWYRTYESTGTESAGCAASNRAGSAEAGFGHAGSGWLWLWLMSEQCWRRRDATRLDSTRRSGSRLVGCVVEKAGGSIDGITEGRDWRRGLALATLSLYWAAGAIRCARGSDGPRQHATTPWVRLGLWLGLRCGWDTPVPVYTDTYPWTADGGRTRAGDEVGKMTKTFGQHLGVPSSYK